MHVAQPRRRARGSAEVPLGVVPARPVGADHARGCGRRCAQPRSSPELLERLERAAGSGPTRLGVIALDVGEDAEVLLDPAPKLGAGAGQMRAPGGSGAGRSRSRRASKSKPASTLSASPASTGRRRRPRPADGCARTARRARSRSLPWCMMTTRQPAQRLRPERGCARSGGRDAPQLRGAAAPRPRGPLRSCRDRLAPEAQPRGGRPGSGARPRGGRRGRRCIKTSVRHGVPREVVDRRR